jgi:hypothetical protein
MGRKASGASVLAAAERVLREAQTAKALRGAQAVVFPLRYDFSMEQTASAIGVSKGWACQLRREFVRTKGKGHGWSRLAHFEFRAPSKKPALAKAAALFTRIEPRRTPLG